MVRMLLVGALTFAVVGCSSQETPTATSTAAKSADGQPPVTTAAPPETATAIGQSAQKFVTAVLAGDSTTALAQLSPQARQQMQQAGTGFDQMGQPGASTRIGEVRLVASDQAIASCLVTAPNEAGQSVTQELGCALRFVNGQWLVCAIMYETGPDQPVMTLNFEEPAAAVPGDRGVVEQSPAPQSPTARTAQDPFLPPTR